MLYFSLRDVNTIIKEECNYGKKIEEIKAWDDEGKDSVQKMSKPIKREKETCTMMTSTETVEISFSSSPAGRLLSDCRVEGILPGKGSASVFLPANLDLGYLATGIDSKERQMFWGGTALVAGMTYSEDVETRVFSIIRDELEQLEKHIERSEKIRIWYSHTSRDLCGLYFVCNLVKNRDYQGQSYYVCCDDTDQFKIDMNDKDFISRIENVLTIDQFQEYCNEWERLVNEDSLLRVLKEGTVVSVSEEYYDEMISQMFNENQLSQIHIWRNLVEHYDEFDEMENWFCYRIERFIEEGKIIVVDQPKRKSRILARTELFPLSEEQIRIREEEKVRDNLHKQIEDVLAKMSVEQLDNLLSNLKDIIDC